MTPLGDGRVTTSAFPEVDELGNCTACHQKRIVGDWPKCPHGKSGLASIPDDIPGGVLIENLGPTPVRVYSHTERLRIAKERGLMEMVRHVPVPGTDKSPNTTDWSKGSIDPYTLENARILLSRPRKKTTEVEMDVAAAVFRNREARQLSGYWLYLVQDALIQEAVQKNER